MHAAFEEPYEESCSLKNGDEGLFLRMPIFKICM